MIPTSAKNKAPPERTLDERNAGGRMSVPGLGRVKTIRRLRAVSETLAGFPDAVDLRSWDAHSLACDLNNALGNEVIMPWIEDEPIIPSRPTMEVSAVWPCSVRARTEMMVDCGK
jgi:hypothetical protein